MRRTRTILTVPYPPNPSAADNSLTARSQRLDVFDTTNVTVP